MQVHGLYNERGPLNANVGLEVRFVSIYCQATAELSKPEPSHIHPNLCIQLLWYKLVIQKVDQITYHVTKFRHGQLTG